MRIPNSCPGSVCGDGAAAARSRRSRRSGRARVRRWCTDRAAIADVGVELDSRAEREALHLPARTFDRAVTEIQRTRGFGTQVAVVRLPGLAHDLAAPGEHVVPRAAVDVHAIDHQLVNWKELTRHLR